MHMYVYLTKVRKTNGQQTNKHNRKLLDFCVSEPQVLPLISEDSYSIFDSV